MKRRIKLRGLSQRAIYTDWVDSGCRRSLCQLLRLEGVAWSKQRIPTAVFSICYTTKRRINNGKYTTTNGTSVTWDNGIHSHVVCTSDNLDLRMVDSVKYSPNSSEFINTSYNVLPFPVMIMKCKKKKNYFIFSNSLAQTFFEATACQCWTDKRHVINLLGLYH
jgi:hypothetical protein